MILLKYNKYKNNKYITRTYIKGRSTRATFSSTIQFINRIKLYININININNDDNNNKNKIFILYIYFYLLSS